MEPDFYIKAPSAQIRSQIVFIEIAYFSLLFHQLND